MSNPCTTCQPMPSCEEWLDRYSLQEDLYWYDFICPPGLDCGGFIGTVTMVCCDGTEYAVTLPEGILADVRQDILIAMANQCARRIAFCSDPGTPPPPTIPPSVPLVIYFNDTQTASEACPDGSLFTYTIQAGRFFGFNYQAINSRAMTQAQGMAKRKQFCLSALPEQCCADTAFAQNVKVAGPGAKDFNSWSVTAGTLPPGLTLATGWQGGKLTTLSGTPTTGGTYTFTIQATNSDNLSVKRSYTICVIGITPGTLPDGTKDVAYSVTLDVPMCAPVPILWRATGLPDGLSINQITGEISGKPNVGGDFAVTVEVETEAEVI